MTSNSRCNSRLAACSAYSLHDPLDPFVADVYGLSLVVFLCAGDFAGGGLVQAASIAPVRMVNRTIRIFRSAIFV